MGTEAAWHAPVAEQLSRFFRNEPDVKAFVLTGSLAAGEIQQDEWSDLDACIVVADRVLERYCLCTDWLRSLGQIVGKATHERHLTRTLHVCLEGSRRLDILRSSRVVLHELVREMLPGYSQRGPVLYPRIESAKTFCAARAETC